MIVTVSPAAARATTADAFCFSNRIPTSSMCFIVAHRRDERNPAVVNGRGFAPQSLVRNPDGHYQLFCIGDAVASRNLHAAIYDALRLAGDP